MTTVVTFSVLRVEKSGEIRRMVDSHLRKKHDPAIMDKKRIESKTQSVITLFKSHFCWAHPICELSADITDIICDMGSHIYISTDRVMLCVRNAKNYLRKRIFKSALSVDG